MISDFERTKEQVCGRSVLITSWYDADMKNWHAGAPRYSYLSALLPASPAVCGTRHLAIQRLTSLLVSHFKSDDAL
jgi:hypothetical protein